MDGTRRVAVVAGTNVDTQMGVDYINSRTGRLKAGCDDGEVCDMSSIVAVFCPVAETCDDQIKFQYCDDAAKKARIDEIFDPEIEAGTRDFFIYCNSLSGAFDFDSYAAQKSAETGLDIRAYTPLQAYRKLSGRFSRVGLMAANNLSAHGIERAFMTANPDMYVIGTGNMAIVNAIEEGREPAAIVRECGIDQLMKYMEACGCEAVVLGCTHFPYLKEEIKKLTELEITDPADMMFDAMIQRQLI